MSTFNSLTMERYLNLVKCILTLHCLVFNMDGAFVDCRAAQIPTVTFNNGRKIPHLGLGTWQSKPDEVGQAVKDAIDVGYRHIDCAYLYNNEKEVGNAIAEKISEGTVKREDLFITSKLWSTFHKPEAVEGAIRQTLKDLRLGYVDLYLIHWPMGLTENYEPTDDDYVDTWIAMEAIHRKGLAKSIGISNFNKKQIERVLARATIVPVTNQVECHPYLNQKKLIEFCKSKNITVTAYSPLGSPNSPHPLPNKKYILEDAKIKEIAGRHRKSAAQIVLRYQVQRGVIVIPKSVHKNRIIENSQIFDFELSPDELAAIDDLNYNGRISTVERMAYHKNYPFNDEY